MKAKIIGEDEAGVAVEIRDNSSNVHNVLIRKADGGIDLYEQDHLPFEREERTDQENEIVQQVIARAKFEAHQETEADILEWDARISILKRAIEAVDSSNGIRFKGHFKEYYRAVVGDPRRDADRERIPFESVQFVYLPAVVAEDEPHFERVGEPAYDYVDDTDERQLVGSQPAFEPNLLFQHYVVADDVTFPEGFRDLLVRHLRCQIRDVYLNMGTEPPPEYDLEGMGKIRIHGRPSIDDEYVTG